MFESQTISGNHMNFQLAEVTKDATLLDSLMTTMVDLQEGFADYRSAPEVQAHIQKIHDFLIETSRKGRTRSGIPYRIIAWMSDFSSEILTDRSAFKVTYTVCIKGGEVDLETLVDVENAIYDFKEEVEQFMKSQFRKVQDFSGKEVVFI
jgi:hypothetical protein